MFIIIISLTIPSSFMVGLNNSTAVRLPSCPFYNVSSTHGVGSNLNIMLIRSFSLLFLRAICLIEIGEVNVLDRYSGHSLTSHEAVPDL
jgi:hypothetical protein